MSLRFPNMTNTPPGGWKYTVPETGKTIGPYTGFAQLKTELQQHYQASGYPMPDNILDKVEGQICSFNPEYCEEGSDVLRGIAARGKLAHTFHTAYQCLTTLSANRDANGEKPTMELASARAETCATCPKNTEVSGCSACNFSALDRLVQKLVGASKTPLDSKLKFCSVCHCNLKAKIWTRLAAIEKGMSDDQMKELPETCWIVTEGKK